MAKVKAHNPTADTELIRRAYEFAEKAHEGQQRASGEAYLQHPLSVAEILADIGIDEVGIAAALLHDVVEDTGVPLADIEQRFGKVAATIVDGVTKLGKLEFRTDEEAQVGNLRKMFFAMAEDLRVIIIRLADRLHNMRTLGHLPVDKQKRIADETLEIYAPLAHRLGIWRFKWELEDLAFRFKYPEEYAKLKDSIQKQRKEREEYIDQVIRDLEERLQSAGIKADIQGRAKHFYSIWQKMQEEQKQIFEIFDLLAVRVIVDSVRDCYAVLGLVHTMWKPLPGRFKDYLAMPKANMYQSLHTTVMGPGGEPFEIQIRTWEMHRTAEYGIAAHWRYKEGKRSDNDFDQKLSWLRQVLEWEHEGDPREFMESLKIDLFTDEVFVFTPKGNVLDLPAGATPIDFAYEIHTDVGHRCVGAKVNGRIVPLDYTLKNGDIVEILTSKSSAGPSRDWISVAKTPGAKNRIRQYFKRQRRDENIARGKEALEKEIRRIGLEAKDVLDPSVLAEVIRKINIATEDDLFAIIGYGGFSAQQIASRLKDEATRQKRLVTVPDLPPEERKPAFGKPTEGVRVRGVDNVLLRLAKCCNPVPGDAIMGYITRGRGVTVHRADCPNAVFYAREPGRLLEVSWDREVAAAYPVELLIHCLDRPGLLSDVVSILAETHVNILHARANVAKDGNATITLSIEIRDLGQLEDIVRRVKRVRDVVNVVRTSREVHA
ncbi:MAG: bifunctional (p)ppGpp synthetase/guanosine-3',5'-bis(diphosphate) 3'-pyrophosphohydrolase [Bacillota bacterium]|nr:bifunctional (p)ppGpp synthetase/guanosine-3',5'-bis(diphosphate) 3'-pyrophosphohydrolase [Bacillota bacterium]